MPTAETAHFGTIEYAEETIFDFPAGLPAFEDERKFIALTEPRYEPLVFFQSLATAGLAFLAIAVRNVVLEYRLEISDEDLAVLSGGTSSAGLEAFALVTVSEQGDVIANLQAPIVIDHETRRGLQVIQTDSGYSARHPLGPQGAPEASPCL